MGGRGGGREGGRAGRYGHQPESTSSCRPPLPLSMACTRPTIEPLSGPSLPPTFRSCSSAGPPPRVMQTGWQIPLAGRRRPEDAGGAGGRVRRRLSAGAGAGAGVPRGACASRSARGWQTTLAEEAGGKGVAHQDDKVLGCARVIAAALIAPARKVRVDLSLVRNPIGGACRGVAVCGAARRPVACSNAGRRPLVAVRKARLHPVVPGCHHAW